MIHSLSKLLFIFITILGINMHAQQHPTSIIKSEKVVIVPSLSSRSFLPPPVQKGEVNPKRRSGQNVIVPGKGLPKGNDPLLQSNRNQIRHVANNPLLTFEAAHMGATPSDPTGAAGPNHYVMAYNTAFKIFDKSGNVLVNDTNLSALFPGHTSDGDPIVLYDSFADRFLITEFDVSSNPPKFLVAISQTSDPVNGGWYVYAFDANGGMPDYPKFSIWSDGYYVTANKNANTASTSQVVFAMERDKMINGDQTAQMIGFPLPGITNNGFYSPSGFNANGNTMPPVGNAPIIYFQDDAWGGVNADHLKIWNINVDWTTPGNSTISNNPQVINTTVFNSVFNNGSFQNLPQPNGTSIDALQATVMFMTNYRRFSNHNSVVLNFVVKGDGNKAAIRWYELRQNNDGDPWVIYQEGTYADPSGHHTFAGSINMDSQGNIGLGYTIVDSNQVPELHFTGRMSTDPIGQMTITPQTVINGIASDPAYRYGDYAQLTIDPSDDKTFWFISEYFKNTGRIDQVCTFKFASDYNNDVGVSNITAPVSGVLSNNEHISIEITNYGLQSQSNFPVSYQIDGGNVVTENFTGTIASGASAAFTFGTTANMSNVGHTYNITVATNLASDQEHTNDSANTSVTNLVANDVGISAVLSPTSGTGLTASETVQVTITNYGGANQSNVPVSYTLDGTSVNEVVAGPIPANSDFNYSFTHTGDFSNVGNHNLSATTNLSGDANRANDAMSVVITKNMCQPTSDCSYGDQIKRVQYGSIDNSSTCGGNGYSDYTNISTDLLKGTSHTLTLTIGYGEEHITAWIDYNDDFVFSNNEKIVVDEVTGAGGAGTYTKVITTNIPATAGLGQHMMRIRTYWQHTVPDACSNVSYGETEDYTVNITDGSSIDELGQAVINIQTIANNHFIVSMENAQTQDDFILTVYTIGGKQIVYHNLKNINGKYTYDLDMNYVAKGVYLLRIGNDKTGRVAKIIVK